jgi:hypothetical protein
VRFDQLTDEEAEARVLRQGIESRVRRLRTVVDLIERLALERVDMASKGNGRYASAAEVFTKELSQAIVNAGLEQLIDSGTTADIYRAEALLKKEMEVSE